MWKWQKRVLEERTDRAIHRLVRAEPKISSRIIKEVLSLPASERTIRRRLHERNLCSFFKKKKTLLQKANIRKDSYLLKKYVNMPQKFWDQVIWTDESKFELKNTKKAIHVWCQPN